MNERIKELYEKSLTREMVKDHAGNPMLAIKQNPEKFAELIVKKCMAVAKYHTPDTEECEHTWLIHDKIGKHFGVEE